MKAVVFLGPSLPLSDAKKILGVDKAIYLPPASQADLLSAVTIYKPDVIAIIDGEFGQSLSIWHKEILFALEKGIQIYGASSMGALRAVETSMFGTIGVGAVYDMYASGEINDDDEVALLHSAEDDGYRNISEPMINIRMTFRKAAEEKVVSKETAEIFTDIAKSIFYTQRVYPLIFRKAVENGIDQKTIDLMSAFVKDHHVDIKAQDAIKLLETLRDLEEPISKPENLKRQKSHLFDSLYDMDRSVQHDGTNIELSKIAHFAALHMKDFNNINFNGLNKALVVMLANFLKIEIDQEELNKEISRFQIRQQIKGEEQLNKWIDENDLSQEEFNELFYEVAVCRKLHRWFLTCNHNGKGTRVFMNELRLKNQYKEWVEKAIDCEETVNNAHVEQEADSDSNNTRSLLKEHLEKTDCVIDTEFVEWAEESTFLHTVDFINEMKKAREYRNIKHDKIAKLFKC